MVSHISYGKGERKTSLGQKGNRNGVDDSGTGSIYEDSIFWMNNAKGGWPTGARYELDVKNTSVVRRCFINGDIIDLNGTLDSSNNSNCALKQIMIFFS